MSTETNTSKASTVTDFLGEEYHAMAKAFAKANGVNVPVLLARLAIHVMTSDGASETIADLCSDAPRAGQRGRKALSPEVKAARETLRKAARSTDVVALQRAIDSLIKA